MVTLSDNPNTWGENQLHECSLDEETETCVGVRDPVLSTTCCNSYSKTIHSNMLIQIFMHFGNLGRGR